MKIWGNEVTLAKVTETIEPSTKNTGLLEL